MASLNDRQIKSLISQQATGKYAAGGGLYLVIRQGGSANWMMRYSVHGKRKEYSLGNYRSHSLKEARLAASTLKIRIDKESFDPVLDRRRTKQLPVKTFNDLWQDYYTDLSRHIQTHAKTKSLYDREIRGDIGEIPLEQVSARDVQGVIRRIAQTRPTIANDALLLIKQIFSHGIKIDVTRNNPAAPFTPRDAGGTERPRERFLSLAEIEQLFIFMRDAKSQVSRENYLAVALLICLGVRKMELLAAKWDEFDLDSGTWALPKERTKKDRGMIIPLSQPVITWLRELHTRACGSKYVFPARRTSKRFPHMSPDTLNFALQKLIKEKNFQHFSVHDLRRTCRTHLAQLGISYEVAMRCLNHKLIGMDAIYNNHDYLEERRAALIELAKIIQPLVDHDVEANINLSALLSCETSDETRKPRFSPHPEAETSINTTLEQLQ